MTAHNQTAGHQPAGPPPAANQPADNQLPPVALPPVHESWLPREHGLYRPRHGPRQILALVCAAVFFAVPFVAFTVSPAPDEFENRALTPFPSPGQGWDFFTQLAPWATDHLPFREDAVHIADSISRGLLGEPPALGTGKFDTGGPVQADKQRDVPSNFPNVLEGKDGWLYLGAEVESHCRPTQSLDETISRLRRLRDGVEASGRKFVVVVAPDKTTMVPARLPDDYPGKECLNRATDEFWRRMTAENYIVDLRPSLRGWAAKLGEPIYGPQDAHWSDEGGVTMARDLAERLRPGISAGWTVEAGANWNVAADIPPLIGRTGRTEGRFYSISPDGKKDQTRNVGTEYTSPLIVDSATGPGTYGFGVGMLSDSFTIRALRYLAGTFGDLTVLHHKSLLPDGGVGAGKMLAGKSVVVIEVAERTLMSGDLPALNPDVVGNITRELAARSIR
jgi:SGNH hydrolase-like domain, acetyltransferase AlgX